MARIMDIFFCRRVFILIILKNLTAEVSSRQNTDAYGCKIVSNSVSTSDYPIYTCTPDNSSPLYEVHVLAVYEVIHRRPPQAGDFNVNIISREESNRPIVLVLGSHEPVNWILNIPYNISISKVILVSNYIDESSVGGDLSQVKSVERKAAGDSDWDSGYGGDSGGGGTARMLGQIDKRFGVVTSFKGTYVTNGWSVELSPFKGITNVAYCGYRGCKNGGRCIGPFVCRCTPEWTGDKCESEVSNGDDTKTSASDERLYYLFFISVPLIIGLGFMADRRLKQRDRRMTQQNQPFRNQNLINLNQQYNERH